MVDAGPELPVAEEEAGDRVGAAKDIARQGARSLGCLPVAPRTQPTSRTDGCSARAWPIPRSLLSAWLDSLAGVMWQSEIVRMLLSPNADH